VLSLEVTNELFQEIMSGLKLAKRSPRWTKESGQFVPNASRWLKAKGWLDVYPRTVVNERGIQVLNPVYRLDQAWERKVSV
jgi:regulatory protein YycI of two-component signal transduction system YycFG